jgi:hypothetical protein
VGVGGCVCGVGAVLCGCGSVEVREEFVVRKMVNKGCYEKGDLEGKAFERYLTGNSSQNGGIVVRNAVE